jgi:hypothetical protein
MMKKVKLPPGFQIEVYAPVPKSRPQRGLPNCREGRARGPGMARAAPLVATLGGPTMFARIGVMRALNAGKPIRQFVPPRKRLQGPFDSPTGVEQVTAGLLRDP